MENTRQPQPLSSSSSTTLPRDTEMVNLNVSGSRQQDNKQAEGLLASASIAGHPIILQMAPAPQTNKSWCQRNVSRFLHETELQSMMLMHVPTVLFVLIL